MRVSVSHQLGREEAIRRIDRSAEDLLRTTMVGPLSLRNITKRWDGDTLHVGLTGAWGVLSQDLRGTMTVTEREVICDFEIPALLASLIGAERAEKAIRQKVKGLLT